MSVVESIINSEEQSSSPVEGITGESEVTHQDAPPEKDERLASRFAAISKKERALQLEREQLKKEREEYEEYKKAKENAKNDPLAYLDKSGLKLEDVIYSGLGSKPEPTVEDKIKQLQERIEKKDQEEKESKTKYEQEQQAAQIESFKKNIEKHIQDNAEKYELIGLANAHNEIYELIAGVLDKTTKEGKPRLMSIEEAADKIEAYYDSNFDEIFTKSKKLGSKYRKIIEDQTENKITEPSAFTTKTLTNHPVTPKSSFIKNDESPVLTLEQRKEAALKRAIQSLQANLSK